MKTFFLKQLLKEKGLSQSNLAAKLGVPRSVVSNWISGVRNPKIENLKKIATILQVPISYFLDEEIDTSTITPLNQETTIKLPILTTAICGKPDFCTIDETVIDDFIEVPKILFPDGNFIVRCQGESMLPEIPPQAYCIIKKMDTPLNNKNMLVKTEDGFTIKRVTIVDNKIVLHYLNPKGKILKAKEVKIIGKVIGIYNKF